MTIPAGQTSISRGVGNGTADTFDYDFKISNKADLKVTTTDTLNNNTVLVVDTDYTVSGVGDDAGGDITLTAGPLADQHRITIEDNVELSQLVPFGRQGQFYANTHESAFDKATRLIRKGTSDNSLALRVSSTVANFDTEIEGAPSALEYIRVNEDGDGVEFVGSQEISTSIAYSNFVNDLYVAADGDFVAGSTTQLTLSSAPGVKANMWVYFDSSPVSSEDYTVIGTIVTFDDPIPGGTAEVEIKHGTAVDSELPTQDSGRPVIKFANEADLTLDPDHVGAYLRFTGDTETIITVPHNDDVPFAEGSEVHVRQADTGQVSLSAAAIVTVNAPVGANLYLAGNGATITVKKVDDNEWDAFGQFTEV